MRLRTIVPISLVGAAAVYALRNTKLVRRRVVTPLLGTAGTAIAEARYRVERLASPTLTEGRMHELADEAALDDDVDVDADAVVRDAVGARPIGSDIGDAMDEGLANLIDAERELMTVEGDDHRRRDQNAGRAAQEIAAAQVRSRRNGADEDDFDPDSFT